MKPSLSPGRENRLLRMRRKFEERVDEFGLSHLRRGKES